MLTGEACFAQKSPFYNNDTGIYTPDTFLRPKTIDIVQRLEDYAKKDKPLSKLLRSVMVFDHKNKPKDTAKVSEQRFTGAENKYIRYIDITVLGPFGYSVTERYGRPINKLQRFGDNMHYPTRHWVIKDKLLFKPNDRIDALKLSESERLIRQSPYIVDARISLKVVPGANDSLDIMVVVQDVFNYSGSAAADPLRPSWSVTATDINFLGLGQRTDQKIWYDPQYSQRYKYSGSYSVAQISNTYTSGELHYNTVNYDKKMGFSFSRPFFSSTSKWAGGLDVEYSHEAYNIKLPDSVSYSGLHNYMTQDFWMGYAFNLNNSPFYRYKKSQLIFSGRIYNINYFDQASNADDLNHVFQNGTLYLGGVGLTHREYYKDRYIFAFGKTEDIPVGYLFTINSGPEISQFHRRWYYGTKASYGANSSAVGYYYIGLEAGGFLNGNNIEQGVLNTQLFYFTDLLPWGSWQVRHYVMNRFTMGYNRRPGENLTINGSYGIPRFSAPNLTGTQRWTNNYEIDFYSPLKPLGFKIVFVAYMDDALLSNNINTLLRSSLYQGYGIGVRFKNEHFIFNTLELSLHFFPGTPSTGNSVLKYVSTGSSNFQFQDFQFSEPYTAVYK